MGYPGGTLQVQAFPEAGNASSQCLSHQVQPEPKAENKDTLLSMREALKNFSCLVNCNSSMCSFKTHLIPIWGLP